MAEGDWTAIIGAGGLGQMGIQYGKAMGFKVLAIEIDNEQLQTATSAGADQVFDTTTYPQYLDVIKRFCPDGVLAAVNFMAFAEAYTHMGPLVRGGGILIVVGIPVENPPLSMLDISFRGYVIKGANNGTINNLRDCIQFSA
jgi:D-arabinose 1-dehydrogenase-like Zn-dependent alcohol dehydrogenase